MKKQLVGAAALVIFIAVCRFVPHLANFSPMICVALFAGHFFKKRIAYAIILVAMVLTDIVLGLTTHYPMFGAWTFFTYTGFFAIMFAGTRIHSLTERVPLSALALLGSSLGFWVWTNLGVWLTSGMYPMTLGGFSSCFALAIPFLQHNVLSAGIWFVLLFGAQRIAHTVTSLQKRSSHGL
ncbi:MAG: hypothetical protein COB66_05455 [Coxiella sp. (in: Bacteria)]|nr:MAG: hypothetical protein COB66_05455 [Coxiella sp. (in: g-proteobacteria)]